MTNPLTWARHIAAQLIREKPHDLLAHVKQGGAVGVDVDVESPEQRLARLCEECITGCVAAAELELHHWQRQEHTPTAAKVLLAALLARRGRLDDALTVLPRKRQLRTDDDQLAAQTLITVLVAADLKDAAAHMLRQLHDDLGHKESVADWLRLMQMPGTSGLPRLSCATVDHLAAELLCQPELIPSLVHAQRLDPDAGTVAMLREAIARVALHDFDEGTKLMICQAMAQLSRLAGEDEDACRWARHGLKVNPYSASLAMELSCASNDKTSQSDTAEVLERACKAHPEYPDLHRALILCEHKHGNTESARLQLAQWLDRQPGHPIAVKLAEELAA